MNDDGVNLVVYLLNSIAVLAHFHRHLKVIAFEMRANIEIRPKQIRGADKSLQGAESIGAVTHYSHVEIELPGGHRLRRKTMRFVANLPDAVPHLHPRPKDADIAGQIAWNRPKWLSR